jgi:murein L,D-transpeptidase YafK
MRYRALLAVAALGGCYAAVLMGGAAWAQADLPRHPCPSKGTLVQVDTRARVLCLCQAGHEVGHFRVALGRGGVDKRAEGDGRTPLGRYSLTSGRSSTRYHLFLPVGYPTAEQVKKGFTGGAIGIHGPHIAFAWLGHATVWPDWTLGCIALSTQSEVEQLSTWIAAHDVREIMIL